MDKNENDNFEDNEFNYECEFTKVEENPDGNIIIAGIATTETLDHDNEIVDLEAVKSAWGDYNGTIRYMHSKAEHNKAAVGVVIDSYVDQSGKTWKTEFTERGPFIVAKISNAADTESIRTKVNEGIIRGFSIGGRARRVKTFDPTLQKDINRVITTRISEISLVDLPANRDSYFEVLKAACVGDQCPLNNDNIESIEKTEPIEIDPVVESAVTKFESIINENNDMKDTLSRLESEIQVMKSANDSEIVKTDEENENNNNISTTEKMEVIEQGGTNMEQTEDGIVRMEVEELTKYIRETVTDMTIEQETVEKLEDYDRLVAEIKDMRAKIENLEAQAKANAKALPTTAAMKLEGDVEGETEEVLGKAAKKKKDKEPEKEFDEDGNEIVESADMEVIKKLESDIAELKSSPLYKAQQEEVTVEKTESEPATGLLSGVITAHYGGT